MRALIAFDKFKDALPAIELCQIAERALAKAQPKWTIDTAPLTDGGDGFCRTLATLAHGAIHRRRARDPLGEPIEAEYAIVSIDRIHPSALSMLDMPSEVRSIAILELAQVSGIALIKPAQRSPWKTTTFGLGELIAEAMRQNTEAVLVGLGGSATHDLALGALQALGFRFIDRDGREMENVPAPERWPDIERIEAPNRDWPILRIACDVTNPLLGHEGAAAVFGPQKGLDKLDLARLEHQTKRIAQMLASACGASAKNLDTPGSGAAGGAAYGLMTALGGSIVAGAALVFAWAGLEAKLQAADLVITGEGRFDGSSLQGKGPGYMLQRAAAAQKPVHVFAGCLGPLPGDAPPIESIHAISPPDMPIEQSMRETETLLSRAIDRAFGSYPA